MEACTLWSCLPVARKDEGDSSLHYLISPALAGLLDSTLSPLPTLLSSITSVTVGVVCLEYEGLVLPPEYREASFAQIQTRVTTNVLPHSALLLVQAFGYLVPSHQHSQVLGVVFDSSTFPQHNRKDTPTTRLTVRLCTFADIGTCRVVFILWSSHSCVVENTFLHSLFYLTRIRLLVFLHLLLTDANKYWIAYITPLARLRYWDVV